MGYPTISMSLSLALRMQVYSGAYVLTNSANALNRGNCAKISIVSSRSDSKFQLTSNDMRLGGNHRVGGPESRMEASASASTRLRFCIVCCSSTLRRV